MRAAQSCLTLQPRGLYSPLNSPGQNTGVGGLSLLQEIFPTQGSNQGLLHCRQILYQLSHKGSPNQLYLDKNLKMNKKGKYLFTAFTSTPWDQGQTTKASLQRWEQEQIWRESFPPSSRDSFPCLSDSTRHLGSTPTTPSFLLSATSWSCFLAKYLLYLGQIPAILRWSTQEFSTIFMLFVFAFLIFFFFFVCKKQENYHWISISMKGLQAIWLKTPTAFLKTEGGVRRGVWASSAQVGPHPVVSLLPRDLSPFFLFNPTGARISPLPWSRCIAVTLFADSRASLPRKASTGWWGHFFPWPSC